MIRTGPGQSTGITEGEKSGRANGIYGEKGGGPRPRIDGRFIGRLTLVRNRKKRKKSSLRPKRGKWKNCEKFWYPINLGVILDAPLSREEASKEKRKRFTGGGELGGVERSWRGNGDSGSRVGNFRFLKRGKRKKKMVTNVPGKKRKGGCFKKNKLVDHRIND